MTEHTKNRNFQALLPFNLEFRIKVNCTFAPTDFIKIDWFLTLKRQAQCLYHYINIFLYL